jgi:diguanylate cyclase (GGDEF)-like protein
MYGVAMIVALTFVSISIVGANVHLSTGAISRHIASNDAQFYHLGRLRGSVAEQRDLLARYALQQDPQTYSADRAAIQAQSEAGIDLLGAAAGNPEMTAATAQALAAIAAWRTNWADPTAESLRLLGSAGTNLDSVTESRLFGAIQDALENLEEVAVSGQSAYHAAIADLAQSTTRFLVLAALFATTVIVLVGWWLMRSISTPLDRLIATAERVRNGESVAFRAEGNDEIAVLARTLERLRLELEDRYHDVHRDAAQAQTFNRLSELMTFAASEAELVNAAVVTLQRLVPSARGELLLLNPSLNRLVVAAAWGDDAPPPGQMIEVDRPNLCPGIRRAAAYVATDVTDPMVLSCPAHPAAKGSVLCLPLLATGQTIGVVHLERAEAHAFDAESQRMGIRVAEQAALALANARLLQTMESLAMTDPLTKLHNNRFFDPLMERQLAQSDRDDRPLSLLMIDVDHFKKFNDTYGHPAGDEALKAFAAAITGAVRESDTVARYGGEEFVVSLPNTNLNAAISVAESLRSAVEQLIIEIGPGRYARITATIGVASTITSGHNRMVLMRAVDQALYRGKQAGRSRVEGPDRRDALVMGALDEAGNSADLSTQQRQADLRLIPAEPGLARPA